MLELPGGGIDEGKSTAEAAAAELGEEAGYDCDVKQIVELTTTGAWLIDPFALNFSLISPPTALHRG